MGELEKATVTGRKGVIRVPGGREQNSCSNPKNVGREILTGGKCQEGPAGGAVAEGATGAAATGPGRLFGGHGGLRWGLRGAGRGGRDGVQGKSKAVTSGQTQKFPRAPKKPWKTGCLFRRKN